MTTTYPVWIFDESEIPDPFGYGQGAVDAIRAMRHPKSRLPGKAFDLPPFMERIVRAIYGPCDEHGNRIVKNAVILLPRGNRKTSLGAALALLHVIGPEAVPGGQVLCAAADRKQARIAFEEAAGIVRELKTKKVTLRDSYNRLTHENGALLEALASEAGTQHGRTPAFALLDELHAWPKRDLYDVMRTGLVKTPGSLCVVISTAGRGQENIAWDVYEYARKVARGEIDDPATLPILFETDADADWRDEDVWRKANPGLAHGFPDIGGLRQLAREAEGRPLEQSAFKQLHLNVWLDGAADPWIDMGIWDEGNTGPIDLDEREGERAWIGVDLGSTSDLTCVSLAFKDDDGGFTVYPFPFAPDGAVRRRQERGEAPYVAWRDADHLITTAGDVTDYDEVERLIRDLCSRFNIHEIAFDRWNANAMMSSLLADGLPVVEHGQGSPALAAP